MLTESFHLRSAPDIVAQLTDLGVKAVVSRGLADLAADEGLRASELFSEHPVAGTSVLTPGRWVSWDPPRPLRVMLAPGLGEHTVEVLRDAGVEPSEITALLSDGCVVQGGPMLIDYLQRYR
jgi:crotonobetainyl-CoA:carnitine CoA-transferase CaiB-like acyl-CoA transferase